MGLVANYGEGEVKGGGGFDELTILKVTKKIKGF